MTYKEIIDKYVKENNIQGYLSSEKDKKLYDILKYEEDNDFYFNPIQTYDYIYAVENEEIQELLCLIYECEFDIEINKDGTLDLIDMQGVYLGGVESYENFATITDVCERLEGSYFKDYYGIDLYEYEEELIEE